VLTDEQNIFISQWSVNKYDRKFFYDLYGEDKVKAWLNDKYVLIALSEIKQKDAEQGNLKTNILNSLKDKAVDIIARSLNGEPLPKDQVDTAKWLLKGENAYIEAKYKYRGEQDASGSSNKTATILEFNYGNKKAD
jgi:hypothetical protein